MLAIQLAAGLGGLAVVRLQDHGKGPSSAVRGRVAPGVSLDERDRAVRALLDVRAAAIRDRDRAAWLSTVDPTSTEFLDRQGKLFDALADVPISDWSYRLYEESTPPATVGLDAKRGPGWWAPAVTLRYRITGYDEVPTIEPQRLTFVPRDGHWYIAADDDFASVGRDTTRGLWDAGRVVALRGVSCIVLGHPSSRSVMRRVATSIDAAVPRVTAVWGPTWPQRVVVLVPSSQDELMRVVGGNGDYSQIAAVATAELRDASSGYHPVGDRIVINPPTFAKLGTLGRRVVLTHEVAHVATRASSGPEAPAWLVEGFADYVGYRGVHVPYSASAAELRSAVRRGQVPAALPTDHDFDGGNARLAQAYEGAWLAVRLLAQRAGEAGLLELYRDVGGRRGTPPEQALESALAEHLGTTTARFTADWRASLVQQLG